MQRKWLSRKLTSSIQGQRHHQRAPEPSSLWFLWGGSEAEPAPIPSSLQGTYSNLFQGLLNVQALSKAVFEATSSVGLTGLRRYWKNTVHVYVMKPLPFLFLLMVRQMLSAPPGPSLGAQCWASKHKTWKACLSGTLRITEKYGSLRLFVKGMVCFLL